MSFHLTEQQERDYEKACVQTQMQGGGMCKWLLCFNDGKGAIMLTDQARTPGEAFLDGVEKFGINFKGVE